MEPLPEIEEYAQETLNEVEQNDDSLIKLKLDNIIPFDFNRLGRAIATNTHITKLEVSLQDLANIDTGFYVGLKRNTSINKLHISGGRRDRLDLSGVGSEILQAYQENSTNLTSLKITHCNIQNQGYNVITTTFQCCTNLRMIYIYQCSISASMLLPMIEAMRGIRSLENLYLIGNRIDNTGCGSLASLLQDPNCNIITLQLRANDIGNEGATAVANSLSNNTKVQEINLCRNQFDQNSIEDSFCKSLCNTSNINSIHSSNHTLEELKITDNRDVGSKLLSLLLTNEGTNKTHVAMKKILRYLPNIDMKPFFKLDGGDENNPKALPYIIGWFDIAREVVCLDDYDYQAEEKKLSAIYQFAKAMPLQFVPSQGVSESIDNVNMDNKKRKRKV